MSDPQSVFDAYPYLLIALGAYLYKLHLCCAYDEPFRQQSTQSIKFVIRLQDLVDIHNCAKDGKKATEEIDILTEISKQEKLKDKQKGRKEKEKKESGLRKLKDISGRTQNGEKKKLR